MNVLRNLTISVASYNNIFNLAISTKSIFFLENPYIFFTITNFWTFWEVLLFQSGCTASLPRSATFFWKKSQFLFKKHIYFIHWNQFLNVLRSLTISVASSKKIFNFGDFYKIIFSFEKPIKFNQNYQILNVSRGLIFSVAFYRKFAGFSNFLKKSIFFRKTHHTFASKNINFERFHNFYYFSRILLKLCYLYYFF